jgi:hypothetical protein
MGASRETPTPALPRKRERGRTALVYSPSLYRLRETARSGLHLPSPACGGGWRARQGATGGGPLRLSPAHCFAALA